MNESDKAHEDFVFRYERATLGEIPVLVTSEFAEQLRAARAAHVDDADHDDGPPSANVDHDATGAVWPGIGHQAGDVPPPAASRRDGGDVTATGEPGLAGLIRSAVERLPLRMCTPILLPEVRDVLDDGVPEVSVSVPDVGSLLSGAGPIADLADRAGTARGADGALISVAGCTAANRIVMAMIAATYPGRPVAVPLNSHHSVLYAAQTHGVPIVFLTGQRLLPDFDAVLPPTADDVAAVMAAHQDLAAVLVTSPSYEGVIAPVRAISEVVHGSSDDCLFVVDQAWGAHLGASAATPPSAIDVADVVTESTHKQGGAPNQAALLLWREGRIDVEALRSAHRSETTTSPSYPLLAGLDTAIRVLHSPRGRARIRGVAELGDRLRNGLREAGLSVLDSDRVGRPLDPMKVTVSTVSSGHTGYSVAAHLAKNGVVVERSGLRSVVMIMPFDAPNDAVERVLDGLASLPEPEHSLSAPDLPAWTGHSHHGQVELRTTRGPGSRVPLDDAVGETAAELVECYPPGVAVLVPGMPITASAIRYLNAVREAGGDVVASDPDFATVLVRRETADLPH